MIVLSKIRCHVKFISDEIKTTCSYYYIKNKRYIIYEDTESLSGFDSFVIDENGQKDYFSITSSYQLRYFTIISYDDLLRKAKIIRRLGNKLLKKL